jgi:hypothetical protein
MSECLNCPGSVSNSSLMSNSNGKIIKFYKDKIVANNGVNLLMDLDLCGLNIPFDQIFRTQLRIPKNSSNVSLQYENILGNKTTFVVIKATYNTANKIKDDNYLQYYFKNQPDMPRTMAQLMILTGTETSPIPPISMNNPSKQYDVTVDIMAATTFVTFEEGTSVINGSLNLSDLKWTDVLSDPTSGDLIIYKNNIPTAYIDVDKIVSVELNGRIILIDDLSAGEYSLVFIDDFNANQANSLITWALADRSRRINVGMQADITPPAITYVTGFNTTIILDNYATTSGGLLYLITKQDLINLWIENVIDNRDGEIFLDDSNITITPLNSTLEISAITNYGRYNIIISVEDTAKNQALDTFVLNAKDLVAPVIILKAQYSAAIKAGLPIGVINKVWINDFALYQINKQNLIDLFIQQVTDVNDGNISLNVNNVTVTIANNLNQSINVIAAAGIYTLIFTVKDSDNNITSQLYENISTPLIDQFNVLVTSFNVTISENQAPIVLFKSPLSAINLYQFSINGIINKSDLYSYLIDGIVDDRTSASNLTLIQNQIFDQSNSQELVYIDSSNLSGGPIQTGTFTFLTQHQDSDGKIGTATVTFNVTT